MNRSRSLLALTLCQCLAAQNVSEEAVPKLTVQAGHTGMITVAAYSPSTRYLVTSPGEMTGSFGPSLERNPIVWDAEAGSHLFHLTYKDGKSDIAPDCVITALCFTPDEEHIILGDTAGVVQVHNLHTRKVRTLNVATEVLAIGTPNEEAFAIATAGGQVQIFDQQSLQPRGNFDIELIPRDDEQHFGHRHRRVAMTSGHSALVAATPGSLQIWDVLTRQEIGSVATDTTDFGVALSPSGTFAAAGSKNGQLWLWQTDAREEATGRGLDCDARSLLISDDGETAAVSPIPTNGNMHSSGEECLVAMTHSDSELIGRPGVGLAMSRGDSLLTSENLDVSVPHAISWLLPDGPPEAELYSLTNPIDSIATSANGELLAVLTHDGFIHVWHTQIGQQVLIIEAGEAAWDVHFAADDTKLVGVREFFPPPPENIDPQAPDYDPDAEREVAVWDLPSGERVHAFPGDTVAAAAGGSRLLAAQGDASVVCIDFETGREFAAMKGPKQPDLGIAAMDLSADGRFAAVSWSWRNPAPEESPPDEEANEPGVLRIYDVDSGEQVAELDGAYLALTFDSSGNRLNLQRIGEPCQTEWLYREQRAPQQVAVGGWLAPDKRVVATWSGDSFELLDAKTGKLVGALEGHAGEVTECIFTNDGKHIWTSSKDGFVHLYDLKKRQLLCRLLSADTDEWAVLDTHGRFDGSHGGMIEGLHWVIGTEVVDLEQLHEIYYTPDLLTALLHGDEASLQDVTDIHEVGLNTLPVARITAMPGPGSNKLEVVVTNHGAGIGPVAVLVNGREYRADIRKTDTDSNAKELVLSVDVTKSIHYRPDHDNEIEVVPMAATSELLGRGGRKRARSNKPKPATNEPASFHAVLAGVSDYEGEGIRLKYAAKDAQDFGVAVQTAAKKFFKGDVHVNVLAGDKKPATRTNLKQALNELKSTKHGDVVLVYLAGHGVTHGKDYFFLTREAKTDTITDEQILRDSSISGNDLLSWLKELPAMKVVLILDTCHSGAFTDLAARGTNPTQLKVLHRLNKKAALIALAGSAADQASYESKAYGQGLLTHSLLRGMRGDALQKVGSEDFVDVLRLFTYAQDLVPQLAGESKKVQRPQVVMASAKKRAGARTAEASNKLDSGTFVIGMLDDAGKAAIPLVMKRSTVHLTFVTIEGPPADPLKLKQLVRGKLAAHSDSPKPDFALTLQESAGALSVFVYYAISGNAVTAKLYIKDGEAFLLGGRPSPCVLQGNKDKLAQLADQVLDKVREVAQKQKPLK